MKFFSAALIFSVLIYEVYTFQSYYGLGKFAPKHLRDLGKFKSQAAENFNEHRFSDTTKWNEKLRNFELKNPGENNAANINDNPRENEIMAHFSNVFRDWSDAGNNELEDNIKRTNPNYLLLKMMKYEPQSELGFSSEHLPNRRRKRTVEGSEPDPAESENPPEESEQPPEESEHPPEESEHPPEESEHPPEESEQAPEESEHPPEETEPPTEGSEPTTEGPPPSSPPKKSPPPSSGDPPPPSSEGPPPSFFPIPFPSIFPVIPFPPSSSEESECSSYISKLADLLATIVELQEKLMKAHQDKECKGGGGYYDYYYNYYYG